MDRWVEAADWIVWQLCGEYVRNACTRRLQGHPPGRPLPESRSSSPSSTRRSPTSSTTKLDQPIGALGDRAGSLTAEMAARLGLRRGHRRRRRQRRRPCHRPGGAGGRPGTARRDHGHVDVPRRQRRPSSARSPACAASSTAGSSTGCGATRPVRAGSATCSAGSSTTACPRRTTTSAATTRASSVHDHLTQLGAAQAVGQHGLLALDWHNGNRSVLVNHELSGLVRRPDRHHAAGGRLPGADGGHGVRGPHDRRDVRRRREFRSTSTSSPAG